MMLIDSLRLFARLLRRPLVAPSMAPSQRRDLAPDVSHVAACLPGRLGEVEALERRVAELSSALATGARRAGAADLLARQTAELSVSGARAIDATVATIGRAKDEVKSLAELLTLIDGITSRMQSLASHAKAEAAWAGGQDAALARLADDAGCLARDGAGTAQAARRHITASVEQVETGMAHAAEAAMTFGDVVRSLEQVRHTLAGTADVPLTATGIAPRAGGTIR
ncbi:hypothetical protein OVY01_01085 [Robbsia sp. Bb-Pol-6]|uniref:Methyl-accepting transducer domain-containing protein n=1 Tax=Robbsia betulipollinis TaxID=2981849 RepID=A0ABT3ZH51_9BURK|nr:hypothetical protein [Robbsia betulipollinis]MCY0385855.1 hypothetical protein [Robbsia betulipollinis]